MSEPLHPSTASTIVTNPSVPFASDILGGVFYGKAILIKGVVTSSSDDCRFKIDLCCGLLLNGDHQDDKALHFNPRLNSGNWLTKSDNNIVLNTMVNNLWGAEQRCHNVFKRGEPFFIRILILKDYFKIAVDGKQLCDYIHRIPPDRIKCIFINGCVQLNLVEFQGTNPSPNSLQPSGMLPENSTRCNEFVLTKPGIPFVQDVCGGFMPPREAHIIFTPNMIAKHIAFNFFVDSEYLIHVRVDFPAYTDDKKGAIVRNSTNYGEWLEEERCLTKFPFLPGITSDILFIAESEHVKIVIDGILLDRFRYRDDPGCVKPMEVNKITILGDLSIQKFELKNST